MLVVALLSLLFISAAYQIMHIIGSTSISGSSLINLYNAVAALNGT